MKLKKILKIALITVSVSALGACSKAEVVQKEYASVRSCESDHKVESGVTFQEWSKMCNKAITSNIETFKEKKSCEEQYGSCQPTSNNAGFSPMVSGFVLGYLLSGNGGVTYNNSYSSPIVNNNGVRQIGNSNFNTMASNKFKSMPVKKVSPTSTQGIEKAKVEKAKKLKAQKAAKLKNVSKSRPTSRGFGGRSGGGR